jgi:hypothetical protein
MAEQAFRSRSRRRGCSPIGPAPSAVAAAAAGNSTARPLAGNDIATFQERRNVTAKQPS